MKMSYQNDTELFVLRYQFQLDRLQKQRRELIYRNKSFYIGMCTMDNK